MVCFTPMGYTHSNYIPLSQLVSLSMQYYLTRGAEVLQHPKIMKLSFLLHTYCIVQMFDGGKFDKFDELKLHHQNFPYQYFTIIILYTSTCNIY